MKSTSKKSKRKLIGFKQWCNQDREKREVLKGHGDTDRYVLWGGRIWDRVE
jgi:hypothetical protein